jgi:hypothetical protein
MTMAPPHDKINNHIFTKAAAVSSGNSTKKFDNALRTKKRWVLSIAQKFIRSSIRNKTRRYAESAIVHTWKPDGHRPSSRRSHATRVRQSSSRYRLRAVMIGYLAMWL